MRDLYSDDYESVADDGADRLIPDGVRRLAGAAVFVALIAGMGLWAYRLGTRDATEVPIIRAMEGPARVEPEDPGGQRAAHQGLEVNTLLAGRPAPAPRVAAPAPTPPALAAEDAPQGELVVAAAPPLPEAALGADDDLRMPGREDTLAVEAAPEFAAPTSPEPPLAEAAVDAEVAPVVPGPRPKVRPANLVIARARAPEPPAPSPPRTAAPAGAAAVAAVAPAPAAAPAAREVTGVQPGTRMVQLGAFDSEEITRQAWARLVAGNGDLLGGKSLYVERTTANARVFYRLRVAGFQDTEQTRTMCEALRARSVDCIPVTLQ